MKNANLFRRASSPYWQCAYIDPTTLRRVFKALPYRLDDPAGRKKAERFAAEKSLAVMGISRTDRSQAWNVWVEDFISDKYRNSPLTEKRVRNAWDWLRVFLEENKIIVPAAFTYNHATAYVKWRTGKRRRNGSFISRNTALLEIKVLGILLREAKRRGFCSENVCERLGITRDATKVKPELTSEDIRLIREALVSKEGHLPITQRWMMVCFEVALHQGCRLREVQVAMSDVNESLGTICFHGKGGKVFTTALHPNLLPLVKDLREAGAPHLCHLPVMAAKEWWSFFRTIPGLTKGVSFHCTRVTAVTRLARAGVNQGVAMRFVGHSSEIVHRIYQRLGTADLKAATQALSF